MIPNCKIFKVDEIQGFSWIFRDFHEFVTSHGIISEDLCWDFL